ncbi:MAG: hypothetical protein J6V06_08570 [Clostridia bacterium]|nr:hypothetical protein [Clostridia bacterium]MBO7320052.1 hypothetical protein [Clostridia bacterium]
MKKAISLILAILTIFSVMSISVAAADKVSLCKNGEHEWVEGSRLPATCTQAGIKTYYCNKCILGVKQEMYADKLAHKDNDHDGDCDKCNADTTLSCKCYCHTVKDGRKGILTPFAIFMQFFASIFKINHYCDCGYQKIYK